MDALHILIGVLAVVVTALEIRMAWRGEIGWPRHRRPPGQGHTARRR